MSEHLGEARGIQAAKERQRLDDAAAIVLLASQVEIDLSDHRRPSEILSSLIDKGFSPTNGPESPRRA